MPSSSEEEEVEEDVGEKIGEELRRSVSESVVKSSFGEAVRGLLVGGRAPTKGFPSNGADFVGLEFGL